MSPGVFLGVCAHVFQIFLSLLSSALQEVVAPMIQVYWRKRLQHAAAREAAARSRKGGCFVTRYQQQGEGEEEQPRRRAWYELFARQQHPQLHRYARNQEVSFRAMEKGVRILRGPGDRLPG